MNVTLSSDNPQRPLADIDLGEPTEAGYFEQGDLSSTAGNLYLHVDGQEWGSLFFYMQGDTLTITLGQHDPQDWDWVETNPITKAVSS